MPKYRFFQDPELGFYLLLFGGVIWLREFYDYIRNVSKIESSISSIIVILAIVKLATSFLYRYFSGEYLEPKPEPKLTSLDDPEAGLILLLAGTIISLLNLFPGLWSFIYKMNILPNIGLGPNIGLIGFLKIAATYIYRTFIHRKMGLIRGLI